MEMITVYLAVLSMAEIYLISPAIVIRLKTCVNKGEWNKEK